VHGDSCRPEDDRTHNRHRCPHAAAIRLLKPLWQNDLRHSEGGRLLPNFPEADYRTAHLTACSAGQPEAAMLAVDAPNARSGNGTVQMLSAVV